MAPQAASQISASTAWVAASPNGKYSITVTDEGINLNTPGGGIVLNEKAININSTAPVNIKSSTTVYINGVAVNISGGATTNITGGIINLNNAGSGFPAARVGDSVTGNPGGGINSIITGSGTVLIGK